MRSAYTCRTHSRGSNEVVDDRFSELHGTIISGDDEKSKIYNEFNIRITSNICANSCVNVFKESLIESFLEDVDEKEDGLEMFYRAYFLFFNKIIEISSDNTNMAVLSMWSKVGINYMLSTMGT